MCGACDKEYATKEGALNCGETERCPKNIHKCTKCSHEYKTQEEADDCGITTECPGFGYKINYVWNDFEMLWKILKEAGQGYQSKPYYSATVTSTSSDESKIEYTASGSTYSRHYIAENKNGFYQRSFLAKLSEADITYNDIDLSTFNWIESLRLVTHVKPQKKIILPTNSVYSFSGNFIKLDNAYTTSYKLYATLRYFMDPEFKTQITELNDITEDTTIYVRLYGVLSNDKNYVSY